MKKLTLTALAATGILMLSGCGSSTPASEEAVPDTVEMPADDAMDDMPLPLDEMIIEDEVEGEDPAAASDAMSAADAAQMAVDEVEAAQAAAE